MPQSPACCSAEVGTRVADVDAIAAGLARAYDPAEPALAPLVRRLQSWRFPRIVAVFMVAIFAFAIIFGLGAFMVSQVSQLANDLPRYESNLTDKIQSLQGVAAGTGPLERASDVLKDLKREIEKPGNVSPAEPSLGGQAQPRRPIP